MSIEHLDFVNYRITARPACVKKEHIVPFLFRKWVHIVSVLAGRELMLNQDYLY
jgi:hypothetical protein